MKRCKECGETKPTTEFYKHSSTKDRLRPVCKVCVCAETKRWQQTHRESERERSRRFRETHPDYNHEWVEANREKTREYVRKWRQAHPEWEREYRELNKEAALERQRRYESRNREARREHTRRWYAEHPDYNSEKSHKRRVLERGNGYEPVDRQAIYDRDGGICHLCKEPVPRESFTLDHLIPIALGGPHSPENVAVAHGSCKLQEGYETHPRLSESLDLRRSVQAWRSQAGGSRSPLQPLSSRKAWEKRDRS